MSAKIFGYNLATGMFIKMMKPGMRGPSFHPKTFGIGEWAILHLELSEGKISSQRKEDCRKAAIDQWNLLWENVWPLISP
jgi:hypothetical protein